MSDPSPEAAQPEAAAPTAEELRQVIHIVEDLTAVMSREVELLRAMRVRDFGELQDHKLGLVQTYEKHTEHLRRHPAFVEAIDPVLRAELTDVMERMHAVMSENRSEEHTSELQSLMRISYAVLCLKKQNRT